MQMRRTNQALLVVWAVITAFVAYLAVGLAGSKYQLNERTRAHAVSYVRLVEQHAAAAFERSDLALQGVLDHLLPGDLRAGAGLPARRREQIEALLLAQQQRTPGITVMPLVGANGDVVAHSLGMPASINVGDRDYFRVLKQQPGTKVAISEAVIGRVSKRWGIIVGRRVDMPDGSFGGMVGAQLDLNDNFIDFYATLPLGRNASVSLRDTENHLLMRHPVLEAKLGKDAADGAVTDRLRAGDAEGVLVTAATMDGVERVLAFRRLRNFPVYAAVGLSLEEALAPWKRERNAALVGGLLVIVAGAFITLVLRRVERTQSLLRRSEIQLREAQRIANLGSWEWSKATDTITWSEELYRIFGLDPKQPTPNYAEHLQLYSVESRARLAAAVSAALTDGTGYELELEHERAGVAKWLIARGEPVRDANGGIVGLRGTAEDITQSKHNQDSIRHQAHYDGLTGVPNRVLFHDRLGQAINFARRDRHELALLFLDLDRFKNVNDTLGHLAGDELLKITAARIRQSLRESDTVARFGGDEFTVILPRITSRADAAEVAGKIIDAVSAPCDLQSSGEGPHRVTIGASIGIAIFPSNADDADHLVDAADAVMYEAKRTGNSFRFCEPRQAPNQ